MSTGSWLLPELAPCLEQDCTGIRPELESVQPGQCSKHSGDMHRQRRVMAGDNTGQDPIRKHTGSGNWSVWVAGQGGVSASQTLLTEEMRWVVAMCTMYLG